MSGRNGPERRGPERPGPDYPAEWDEEPEEEGCDCQPEFHGDGSVSHEQDCAIYPWCPHEVGAYVCLIPCGCPCRPCVALNGSVVP